jgi:hypothetical protein
VDGPISDDSFRINATFGIDWSNEIPEPNNKGSIVIQNSLINPALRKAL